MRNIERCLDKLNSANIKVYRASPTLLFALTDEKILVMTSFHTFFLRHTHRNFIPRLNRIRRMIESNEIHNPSELIDELGIEGGNGIEMVITSIDWHIGKI